MIAVEDISTTKKRLKIEVPADIIEKEYRDALENVKKRARIPGFRPGKAPESMIEKRFGDDIRSDIIDRIVPKYYSDALKETSLVPVTLPTFEEKLDLKRNQPLAFALTVEVRPNVPDFKYEGLKVEDVPVEVEDKEVDETLKGLQEERAIFEVVDRDVRADDLIVIDYMKFDPTGTKEISSAKDQVMNLGNNIAPKGILDELVGKKKGDVVDITLPAFDKGEEASEGKDGDRLRITIKEIKEKKLPSVDDEFAKDFGKDDLAALRAHIREGLLKAKKDRVAGQQKEKLIAELAASYEFDLPESLLEKELETLMVNEKHRKKPDEPANPVDDALLREQVAPQARQNVKTAILLDLVAERERVTVSEEEMRMRIGLLARHLQTNPEHVVNLFMTRDGSLENLRRTIRDEKVMEIVLAKAEIVKGVS